MVVCVWGMVIRRVSLSSVCGILLSVGGSSSSVDGVWSSIDVELSSMGAGSLSLFMDGRRGVVV